jgi:CHAT domain-containing protein
MTGWMRASAITCVIGWLSLGSYGLREAVAAPLDQIKQMEVQLNELINAGRLQEAEQLGEKMLVYARQNAASLGADVPALLLGDMAAVYAEQGRFQDAEQVSLLVIETLEKRHGPNYTVLQNPLTNLGISYNRQQRFDDAVRVLRRALALGQAQFGADSPQAALWMENLATSLDLSGYRVEADQLYKRALAINVKAHGANHPTVMRNLTNLGQMYKRERRLAEAASCFQQVIDRQSNQARPVDIAAALQDLAETCALTDRLDEAAAYYRRASELRTQIYGADHPLALLGTGLDDVYFLQGRYDEAEKIRLAELGVSEKYYGPASADVADKLFRLAVVYWLQQRYAEGEALLDRAVDILGKVSSSARANYHTIGLRGMLAWRAGHRDKADADFAESMRLADEARTQAVGAEVQRAQSFNSIEMLYRDPADCYLEGERIEQGFACMERGRARSLVDQLSTSHADLLAGLPRAQRDALEGAVKRAQAEIAGLEKQLENLAFRRDLGDGQREAAKLNQQLLTAQHRAVEAYADIRTASPRYRELVGRQFKPIELPQLAAWLGERQGMMLYYAVAQENTWLIAIGGPSDKPRATRLQVTDEQSRILGIPAGGLRPRSIETMLINDEGTGVLQWISNPKSSQQARPKLAALWQLLIPAAERPAIVAGKIERLVVVPDGALGMLPFETLVPETVAVDGYLIDVGPAIDYVPSASILLHLAQRPALPASDREPVLTVGDPAYELSSARSPARGQTDAQSTMAARFAAAGLNRLPYSGQEASWVADVFVKQGILAAILKDKLATERMVRENVAGRRIVHLACHGLVDQNFANFFGALALTPGDGQEVDPTNDGFLSLPEIYELDLTHCELAILSACQTNYGPQQHGEGIWALTRGFIVAGSRRVVASNWLVDDKAAASIISSYCGLIAQQVHAGQTPDYSAALRDAKRWARRQTRWNNPYYWATFVLVGPN